ncbi:MAG: hypothetical protein P1U46_02025 [Patescibacteria group bacterium]|nr:hypothetical protein [Patescibacteria group bacterium]
MKSKYQFNQNFHNKLFSFESKENITISLDFISFINIFDISLIFHLFFKSSTNSFQISKSICFGVHKVPFL